MLSAFVVAQELPRDPRGPGTIEMAQLLETLILQNKPMENRFLNQGRVDFYHDALKQETEPKRDLELM